MDTDEKIIPGTVDTYRGRKFDFKEGKWTIIDENGDEFPIVEIPPLIVGRKD